MTASSIIVQARERLGDLNKQRWTDNRLLSIVSQGQTDICIESGYLRREVYIPLALTESIYKLPDDCLEVKRVEFDGTLLPLHTRSDKDRLRANITSEYTAYKSNLNTDKIEIQPRIEKLSVNISFVKGEIIGENISLTPLFGVITYSDNPLIEISPAFGAVTSSTGNVTADKEPSNGYGEIAGSNLDTFELSTPNNNYGVTTGIALSNVTNKYGFITDVKGSEVSGFFGVTANISAIKDAIKVYYTAIPRKLRFINAVLVIPEVWEELLLRYVVGTALQDDNDANNIQRGELELQKYQLKLNKIKSLSAEDYSAMASNKYETTYRRV